MSERTTLEIIAPTVEEALQQGLAQLGLTADAVSIEVLDSGTKGLFGLGGRQVRVRLSVNPPPGEYKPVVDVPAEEVKEKPKAVAAFVKASMEGWKSYLIGDARPGNALIRKDNPNMTDDLLAYGIRKIKEEGMVMGGDAAKYGIGVVTDARMKQTYDMLVQHKLLDPNRVDLKKTYTTEFVKDLKAHAP